jgi:hypothetical protein
MKLNEALDKCKDLELKMSEVYLWCSSHYEGIELRQLFFEMSNQEQAHARMLDEIARAHKGSEIKIELTTDVIAREEDLLNKMIQFVKLKPELDELLLRIADMESQEVNLIFESICQSDIIGTKLSGSAGINTKFHINLLKKAVESLPLKEATKQAIYGIQIRDKHYYRLFNS